MSFESDMAKFAKKTNQSIDDVVKFSATSLFNDIITRTPVDSGRLRGNWQASFDSPATGMIDTKDKSGSATKEKIKTLVKKFDISKVIFLTNNLPYANSIEYGRRSKKIAPAGMVRVSMARIKSVIEKKASQEARK